MTDVISAEGSAQAVEPEAAGAPLTGAPLAAYWKLQIDRFDRKAGKLMKRGKRIYERYAAEKKDEESTQARYNILWSSMQTLKPALYAKDPTPEVERRFKDKDPVGRVTSDVLERSLAYVVSKQHFGDAMRSVVLDRLLPGRGVMWVRYVPHFRAVEHEGETEGAEDQGDQITDDSVAPGAEAAGPDEEIHWEEVKFDFVPYTDVGHTIARGWDELDAVWRVVFMDRRELITRFGEEKGRQVPLDELPDDLSKEQEGAEELNKGKVYEIWDKRTRRAIWISKKLPEPLDVKEDPLGLEDFFPCPKFLQATTSSSSYLPTADFILWQDQANELDRLTNRIAALTRAIKVTGIYDASVPALQRMLNSSAENTLIAVPTWAQFAEKGGLKGSFELLPIQDIAAVLLQLYDAREHVKSDLYEISGLSDLMRGENDPDSTATAEKIKSNFVSMRLKSMQGDVQAFARDALRIAAEIIAEHFQIETIKQICGVKLLTQQEKQAVQMQLMAVQQYQQRAQAIAQQQPPAQPGMPPQPAPNPAAVLGPPPQQPDPEMVKLLQQPSWEDVEGLLRDNAARSFRIDIETDSTIAQDEQQDQQQRMEFAKTVGELVTGAMNVVQSVPTLAPAMSETVMFVLRAFKVGRPTESAFQEAMDKLAAMADQPPQDQGGKDANGKDMLQVEQVKQQGEQQRTVMTANADMQKLQAQHQMTMEANAQKFQQDLTLEQVKQEAENRRHRYEADLKHQREMHAMQLEHESRQADRVAAQSQHAEILQAQAQERAAQPVGA